MREGKGSLRNTSKGKGKEAYQKEICYLQGKKGLYFFIRKYFLRKNYYFRYKSAIFAPLFIKKK